MRLIIAHDEVAQRIGTVWDRLLLGPAVGAAQAIDNMGFQEQSPENVR
jgi:hypothetical protein